MLDAAAGGSLLNKGTDPGLKIIDDMAVNQSQWHTLRGQNAKQVGVLDLDTYSKLSADLSLLNKKVDKLSNANSVSSNPSCNNCNATDHWTAECQFGDVEQNAEVNALNQGNQGNFRPNNPYSNTYNPGWRNHPNFSWRNQNDQSSGNPQNQGIGNRNYNNQGYGNRNNYGNQSSANEPRSNFEKMVENFMALQEQNFNEMKQEITKVSKATKVLETQIAQIADQTARPPGTLPPKPDVNPKEMKVVQHTLRSGRQYQDPEIPEEAYIKPNEGRSELDGQSEEPASQSHKMVQPNLLQR